MSVALVADAEVRAGVALVTIHVRNPTPVARRVRVANRLAGPVLPPRRNGVPEAGWDDDGVTAIVDAGDSAALGYACPLGGREAVDPPAELAEVGDPDERRDDAVARARRDLGPFRPPRDAVPLGTATDGPVDPIGESSSTGSTADSPSRPWNTALPDDVAAYLDHATRRIELAERLTDASVPEATDALAECDVAPDVLAEVVDEDAETLRVLSERAGTLASRAEATNVPADALRRLA
ncbi:hypothetical protein HUG10_13760 [Halorarum halophilum]|uniref:DUF8080 domain-containing protein n=2 Tax=Halorarum halophilum TaxID=2743090 RepID=A0A7D5GE41_9EURY|nr:hypothetical protein HUG10_13760 [Halobaculum halophilum]